MACRRSTTRAAIDVIAVVAYGMGGAKGGRVAAELAVRGFVEGCTALPITRGVPQIGAHALDSVNRWLHTLDRLDAQLNGMACILGALVLCGRQAHLLHVLAR